MAFIKKCWPFKTYVPKETTMALFMADFVLLLSKEIQTEQPKEEKSCKTCKYLVNTKETYQCGLLRGTCNNCNHWEPNQQPEAGEIIIPKWKTCKNCDCGEFPKRRCDCSCHNE